MSQSLVMVGPFYQNNHDTGRLDPLPEQIESALDRRLVFVHVIVPEVANDKVVRAKTFPCRFHRRAAKINSDFRRSIEPKESQPEK